MCILVVVIFTAVTQSAGESFFDRNRSGGMYDLICVTAAAAVITPQLLSVYSGAITAIEQTGSFLLVFVPTFSGITVATGAVTTGSFYNMMILAASEVIVKLSESFLTPLLSLMAVFAITGSIIPNASVSGFSELLKKTSTWGLSIAMALFTGFVSMKCTLSSRADVAASKAVKMMISGFVPVVGGAVSDAYTSVRSGLEVIRCTVGVGGNIAIAMMILPPIIKIAAFRIVLWAGTAAADLFSAQSLSKLMKGLDGGLAIAQSVLLRSLKTGNAVCQHDLVGVSNMRLAGCIGNGRCNIIWFLTFFTHFFHSSCQENAQLFCLSTVTGIPAFSVPFSNSFVNILLRF